MGGMLELVGSFGGILKVSGSSTKVDSTVFQLHYRWTATLFFLAAALVTASEFMGDPIKCIYKNAPAEKPIETFCWISSTYTINTTVPHEELKGFGNAHKQTRTYHAYYQWVPFVLFFMGCMFYVPHLIWKHKEGKCVGNLLQGLYRKALFEDTDGKPEKIIRYMNETVGCNNHYFTWYLVLEACNLVNVVMNMFVLDKFVGGAFWKYGLNVLTFINMDDDERDDPMKYTFPRLTMCSFYYSGPSGTIVNQEMLCILPQNIMNEKIFLLLWVWMVVLTTVTSWWIVWQIVVHLSPVFRLKLVENVCNLNNDVTVSQHIQLMHLGDFCLLEVLSKNLDIASFNEVLKGISKRKPDGRIGSISSKGSYTGFKNEDDF